MTRAIPETALDLLRRVGDVWVSPDNRPLRTEEFQAAVAGADAVVTMLHDREAMAVLAARNVVDVMSGGAGITPV